MMISRRWRVGFALPCVLVLASPACKDDAPPSGADECTPGTADGCPEGRVCERVVDGTVGCFAPVTIAGGVFDTASDAPIVGARVVVQDANGVAVSDVAVTDEEGGYSLVVPAPRQPDGTLAPDTLYTLRADAAGFVTFPRPPRVAIPIDVSGLDGDAGVIDNASTDVALIAQPDTAAVGIVTGRVVGDGVGGTYVVAGGATAIAGADGSFTLFDVPAGTVAVAAYRLGVNVTPATVEVEAGETTAGVELTVGAVASAVVSGSVNIVNPGDGALTSIILVVEDTFEATTLTGQAPPGFLVGEVRGAWSLAGVPDGDYVVLAAFENDYLVRDPDTSIGGTEIQRLTVAGEDVTVPVFKITGALGVISPGATGAEPVTAPVTLSWEDDSSEDAYEVVVFDALGQRVWETSRDGASGSASVTVEFPGPLTAGMYYQFRVTSLKDSVPISATEDLKGVFYAD